MKKTNKLSNVKLFKGYLAKLIGGECKLICVS